MKGVEKGELRIENEVEYVPIAALNQYSYCAHRCWRMFCAGEFSENQFTIEGTSLHDRVHTVGKGTRDEVVQVRAIWLRSERYGLIGKSDLVEMIDGRVIPVEYKRSAKGEWGNDALQVCAQALCLEEMMGCAIAEGYVYYAGSHQRVIVNLDKALRRETVEMITVVRSLFTSGVMPRAEYGARCKGCSLYSACLPQAVKKVNSYQEVV
jgi:CRISPR-associated exonuclease Cas4